MTRDEFVEYTSRQVGVPVDELEAVFESYGLRVVPCACGDAGCKRWRWRFSRGTEELRRLMDHLGW